MQQGKNEIQDTCQFRNNKLKKNTIFFLINELITISNQTLHNKLIVMDILTKGQQN